MKQLYGYLFATLFFISSHAHGEMFTSDTTNLEAKIHALHEQVVREGRLITFFQKSAPVRLPIGLVKEVDGKQHMIIIHNATLTAQGAFFDAYISLEVPFTSKPLTFEAKNVPFHSGGLTSGMMRLTLASKHERDINSDVKLILPADGDKNYVEWDCDGLKSVNLKGTLQYSDMHLTNKIETGFELSASDPDELPSADSDPFLISFGKDKLQQVSVYPNANQGRFEVKLLLQQSAESKIEIYNMYGTKVAERQFSGDNFYTASFDLSDQQSGIYLLRAVTGEEETVVKVMVNK